MYNTIVYYNNFDISSLPGVTIHNHDFIGMPNRDLKSSKLARADKSLLTSAEYVNKPVTITGIVCGDDKNDTEDNYDALKASVQVPEGILKIEQGGENVEYVGTLNAIQKYYFGDKLRFTFTFLCSNPIGSAEATSTLLNVNNTLTTITQSVTILGSFKVEPIFTLTYNSVTGGTNKNVSLLNAATGFGIRINEDFATSDVLVVNGQEKEVTLNSSPIDYAGNFPVYFPGIRSFQYIDDFTARDVDIVITYNKQFA